MSELRTDVAAFTRDSAVPAELEGGEPEAISHLRRQALAAYREIPWPSSTRDEDWRRTPQVDKLDPASYLPATPGGWLRQMARPGAMGEASSAVASVPAARELGEVLRSEPERWAPLLGSLAAPGLRKLVALNTARFREGSLVHVARGEQLEEPVRIRHGVGEGEAAFPRTLVVLEEGASATILEEWVSPESARGLLVPVTEVVVGRGAKLTHLISQRLGTDGVLQSTLRARLMEGASYQLSFALLGGLWGKTYVEVDLAGEGCEFRSAGLCVGQGAQHFDLQSLQDHLARGAVSDLLYRAAVADRSRSVFAGLIRVEEGAQKTNAYVQNRNLLLSPTAKADSNPTLEILANDVRCTHGTAAGRIDEEQLFYCQSRGVTREEARRLVVEGFFADVVDSFPEGELREEARGWVLSALDQLARSGALSAHPS
jgi:Fe-S cluster assembly protein SufD